MRRRIPTLLLIAATVAASACGDNSTTAPVLSAKTAAGSGPSFSGYNVSGGGDDAAAAAAAVNNSATSGSATFSPSGGTLSFGGLFTLTYREGSVSLCDKGGTQCAPLTEPVTVTVTYGIVNGGPAIDFGTVGKKHLYFAAPGAKLATSYYASDWRTILASGQHLGFLFAPAFGSAPSELHAPASHFDRTTGELWRWVRHFTGYNVAGGDGCDPNVDPTCASSPDAGM